MARRLPSGIPRRWRNHRGLRGHLYREHYQALEKALGRGLPLAGLLREDAADVAVLWVNWRIAEERSEQAQHRREVGRGRRPSEAGLARLQKRAALEWDSYDKARRELEARASRNGHGESDPLAALLRRQEASP